MSAAFEAAVGKLGLAERKDPARPWLAGDRMQFDQLKRRGFITLLGGAATWPVRAENLSPDVLVMQPADHGVRHDTSDLLNRARDRRILVQ
jgi:hypothetical protein